MRVLKSSCHARDQRLRCCAAKSKGSSHLLYQWRRGAMASDCCTVNDRALCCKALSLLCFHIRLQAGGRCMLSSVPQNSVRRWMHACQPPHHCGCCLQNRGGACQLLRSSGLQSSGRHGFVQLPALHQTLHLQSHKQMDSQWHGAPCSLEQNRAVG